MGHLITNDLKKNFLVAVTKMHAILFLVTLVEKEFSYFIVIKTWLLNIFRKIPGGIIVII